MTRHESGATFAAEAYGKLARGPAAAFVTRGPGATNAAIGIHTATQDSTPLLLFVGHVPTHAKGREAFQEIDYHRMYAPVAKAVLEPETRRGRGRVHGAGGPALRGRAGRAPSSWSCRRTSPRAARATRRSRCAAAPPPGAGARGSAGGGRLVRAARATRSSIAGEMVAFEDATSALVRFAEASGAGVVTAWRRQDTFPNDHPAYLGHFGIGRAPSSGRRGRRATW